MIRFFFTNLNWYDLWDCTIYGLPSHHNSTTIASMLVSPMSHLYFLLWQTTEEKKNIQATENSFCCFVCNFNGFLFIRLKSTTYKLSVMLIRLRYICHTHYLHRLVVSPRNWLQISFSNANNQSVAVHFCTYDLYILSCFPSGCFSVCNFAIVILNVA